MRQKTQTRTAYMHLMDGYPAVPGESGQIRFVGGPKYPARLSNSLSQIRREQRISIAASDGHWAERGTYGYARVELRLIKSPRNAA